MSATLHAIRNAATGTVEVDGLHFQIRKVRASDVAQIGVAAMAMMNPSAAAEAEELAEGGEALERALSRMSPKQVGEITEMQAAICCAGVMAISTDGAEWEPVDLVMESKKEDPDAGRLCVHTLPPGVVESCFSEILELSTDRGGSADRLRSFLETGEPSAPATSGHAGKKIRKNARRASSK